MLIYPNAKESGLINMAKDWLLYDKAELPPFVTTNGRLWKQVLGMAKIGSGSKK